MNKSKALHKTIASNLLRLRMQKGFSQEGFAEACGLHRTYIGAIERAERNITLSTLQKIADALDIEIIQLFKK